MSKTNNVNPGQYKLKGRQRQGENIVHDLQKQKLSKYGQKAGSDRAPKKPKR